jgi:hypothetical protein
MGGLQWDGVEFKMHKTHLPTLTSSEFLAKNNLETLT